MPSEVLPTSIAIHLPAGSYLFKAALKSKLTFSFSSSYQTWVCPIRS